MKSIGENLSQLGDFFVDPLGVNVEKDLTDVDEQAAEQEVGTGTFRAMKHLFDGDLGAFSYLLMVLLYIPCCARSVLCTRGRRPLDGICSPLDYCYGLWSSNDCLSDRPFQSASGVFLGMHRRVPGGNSCNHYRPSC